jgi:hypothetical protein
MTALPRTTQIRSRGTAAARQIRPQSIPPGPQSAQPMSPPGRAPWPPNDPEGCTNKHTGQRSQMSQRRSCPRSHEALQCRVVDTRTHRELHLVVAKSRAAEAFNRRVGRCTAIVSGNHDARRWWMCGSVVEIVLHLHFQASPWLSPAARAARCGGRGSAGRKGCDRTQKNLALSHRCVAMLAA